MKKKKKERINPVVAAIKKYCPVVRIGSSKYEIRLRTPRKNKGKGFYGMIWYVEEFIEVSPEGSSPRVLDTFLHEVLHGIIADRLRNRLTYKEFVKVEEVFVGQVASGLAEALINNPGFAKVCSLAPTLNQKESK